MVWDSVTFILFLMVLGWAQPVFGAAPNAPWTGWRGFYGLLGFVTVIIFLGHLFGKIP